MSKENVRIRFDRSFSSDSDPGKVLLYLEAVANKESRSKADRLQELMCLRYLPFAIGKTSLMKDRLKAIQALFGLESIIQEILMLWDMPDPRFPLLASASPSSSNIKNDSVATVRPTSALGPDDEDISSDSIEDESEDSHVCGNQSVINRMNLI